MAQQLHKRFSDAQVKGLTAHYLQGEVERRHIQEVLGIRRRRFWTLVGQYRAAPAAFSL
ncbi:hypothetical protein IBX73_03270 [candidate division WOR-3 bacterium]|nr:hypothetical protein [candidate division WOR-3 bacterium]